MVVIPATTSARALRELVVGPATALVFLAALVGCPHPAAADEGAPNACGCHQTAVGLCVCERKSKCGCPGECEPKGCEERRAKQLEKEIQAETKKAEEGDRKRQEANAQERTSSDVPEPEKPAVRVPKVTRGKKMTAAQKKELSRLLELYVGENPDRRNWTIEQIDDDLTP